MRAIKLPKDLVSAVEPKFFQALPQTSKARRAIGIGKPCLDKHANQTALSITDFPEVENLIRFAHAGFGLAEPPWDRIDIIIRSHYKGGALTPHVDRPDVFGDEVYTCILQSTSDQRLTFHAPEKKT